jgi:hypothetical protein
MADDREAEALVWIAALAARSHPTASTKLQEYVARDSGFPVRRGWVNTFIGRHSGALCKMKKPPQEAERLEIPRCFLDETVSCLTKFVQARPTELTFNLVPVPISDWEHGQTKTVLVPAAMTEHPVHHKVSRRLKHISVIARVSAAREGLMPSVVTSQNSTRVVRNMWIAFRERRFEFDSSVESYRARLNEEKLRETPGLRGISSLDPLPEKLSTGCRDAKFGWIHKPS